MFLRKLHVLRVSEGEGGVPVPLAWLDSFAMRNFTNNAAFDDTLPVADGLLEASSRVALTALQAAMEDWFRRKGWLKLSERLQVLEREPLHHTVRDAGDSAGQ